MFAGCAEGQLDVQGSAASSHLPGPHSIPSQCGRQQQAQPDPTQDFGVLTLSSPLSPHPAVSRSGGVWKAGQSCPQRRAGQFPAHSCTLCPTPSCISPLNSPGNSFHKLQRFLPKRAQPRSSSSTCPLLFVLPQTSWNPWKKGANMENSAHQLVPEAGEEEGEKQQHCWHLLGHSWHRGAECRIWRLPRRA